MEHQINSIERSQNFMSDQYDQINACSVSNKQNIAKLQAEVKSLSDANAELKLDNNSFTESIIDLKCRSMRDNLLFFGVNEGPRFDPIVSTFESGSIENGFTCTQDSSPSTFSSDPPTYSGTSESTENCAEKVFTFCEKILHISDPKAKIRIIRAHRIGKITPGKTRPIVAKFDTDSKMLIKSFLKKVKLQHTDYNVSEQYPQEVKDRRKELIPVMLEARKSGKRAVLVRDKLFIDNVQYSGKNDA
jgi:hypothetical protein